MKLIINNLSKIFPAFFEDKRAIELKRKELKDQIRFQTLQADRYRYYLPRHAQECRELAKQAQAELNQLTQKQAFKIGSWLHG
ncbi:hypothetical protein COMNV_00603 [Commensalibacter sp. Nvir]|nr:hypothetical protein COMNV_00603 [Commensalibacter sp. Nvir]